MTWVCAGDFAVSIHIQDLEGVWDLLWRHEELQVHGYNEVPAPECRRSELGYDTASRYLALAGTPENYYYYRRRSHSW